MTTNTPNNEVEKEFDDLFGKHFHGKGFLNPDYYEIKSFLSRNLALAREQGAEEVLKIVEAEMLDKIYFIGNELPQVKEDARDKFVLLGYPQKFLDGIKTAIILKSALLANQEK